MFFRAKMVTLDSAIDEQMSGNCLAQRPCFVLEGSDLGAAKHFGCYILCSLPGWPAVRRPRTPEVNDTQRA
jgi:hypothetical protein